MALPRTRRGRRVMRHARVRRKVKGTSGRPRLAGFRSLNHVYAQVIDDSKGVTLAAASTLDAELRGQQAGDGKSEASKAVGDLIARRAKAQGITEVVFDRAGYKYHGRVKVLAEAAREGGLVF